MHAQYAPSKLARILKCPGSIALELAVRKSQPHRLIDRPCEAAEHGTRTHERIEQIINERGLPTEDVNYASYVANLGDFEDEDQELHIRRALRYLADTLVGYTVVSWEAELQVTLADYALPEIWGTADLVILAGHKESQEKVLHVIDWKFGRMKVNAYMNDQLQAYIHGALAYYGQGPEVPVIAHIVQPAIDNYQSWSTSHEATWLEDVERAIKNSESDMPTFAPSEDTCRWCDCRAFCSARLDQIQASAQMAFATLKQPVSSWSEEQVQDLLDKLLELKSVSGDILDVYKARLMEGKPVPGYKLVQGRGRRKWKDFNEVAEYFETVHPALDLYEVKPRSVAQLEKFLTPKQRKEPGFQDLIEKSYGLTMVKEDTPGQSPAQAAFAGMETQ